MKEKLVIVGAGMASGRMLEHLFEIDRNRFDVTLFGAEPRGNYNRILLSPVLAGEKSFDEIVTTIFIAGPEQRTLPLQMFDGVREQISPTITAAATLLIAVSVVALVAIELLRVRSARIYARR